MPSRAPSFIFSKDSLDQIACDVLICGVLQGKDSFEPSAVLSAIEPFTGAAAILSEEKFDGSRDKTALLRSLPGKSGPRRVIAAGLGKEKELNAKTLGRSLRAAVDQALSFSNVGAVAIAIPAAGGLETADRLLACVDAVYDATYASREAKKPGKTCSTVLLSSEFAFGASENDLKHSIAIAAARSSSKDLTNMPPNLKRTTTLVEKARSIAALPHMKVDIIDDRAWIEKEMPCFFTVARGSLATDPPKFIRAHFNPPGARRKIAIVGKSVIFDTGGYQVKTDDYMNTMKADMTGGAMALSVLEAFAGLGLENTAVSAYCAATPNMIDSEAMLPDSIVSTTCGKKVEIRHTDAEGRLTLIDAVAKACEDKPDLIITVATLTGSAARAVGEAIALMGNHPEYRERLAACAKQSGDPCQTLDIWDEDFEDIKSKLDGADIINTSQNKNRGAQSACAFVMSGLTAEIPMLHLDIAGADMTKDEKATGIGVKALLRFLIGQASAA